MVPTSAMPIMSAAVVAEVRRGLRVAFCCARWPASPPKRAKGAPRSVPAGRARAGERAIRPMKAAITARATGVSASSGAMRNATTAPTLMQRPAQEAYAIVSLDVVVEELQQAARRLRGEKSFAKIEHPLVQRAAARARRRAA